MTEPIGFTSLTERHSLPFLFAGQAQKEFFVNEALARIDLLLHPAVEGELSTPPPAPPTGSCWLVGEAATGEWSGHAGEIACWQAGRWVFAAPVEGMLLRDLQTGAILRFGGFWQRQQTPAAPTGGSTVDAEARAAISALIATLRSFGIFSDA